MACHGSPPHSRRSPWRQCGCLTRYENMASQDPASQIPLRLTAHPLPSPRHSRSGRVFLPLFFRPITYPVFVVRKQRTVVPSRRELKRASLRCPRNPPAIKTAAFRLPFSDAFDFCLSTFDYLISICFVVLPSTFWSFGSSIVRIPSSTLALISSSFTSSGRLYFCS